MDRDPTDPADSPVHRPLPSVNIPILREQVHASRIRRILVAGAAAGAVSAIAMVAYCSGNDGDEASELAQASEADDARRAGERDAGAAALAIGDQKIEAAEPAVAAEETAPAAAERSTVEFGNARSFRHALSSAGISREESVALEGALDSVMDFRRCRPADRFVIERDVEGTLVRFEYHPNNLEYFVSRRSGPGSFEAEKVERPVERIRISKAGRVETSLGDALERAGLGRSLVGSFVDVFGSRANFNTDTRVGDSFRIIVDEERLDGELLRYGTVHALEYDGTRTGTLRAFYFEPSSDEGDFFDESGRSMHGSWLRTPLRYDHISSPFDPQRMHPILRRVQPHNGVDYAAGTGTPVWAAAAGVVTWAGPKGANGNLVAIRHDNGFQTFYAHLHRIDRNISRGTTVRQRQIIGQVGTTGRSTGPHLHFGLKRGATFVDPVSVINGPGRMLPPAQLSAYRRVQRRLANELAALRIPRAPAVAVPEPM